MNYRFVFRQLSFICAILAGLMAVCLLWAHPLLGGEWQDEASGVFGLGCSILISLVMTLLFHRLGRNASDFFSKKEATAVVGLSWILATILGALPYLCAGVQRSEGVPMSVCDALFESQSGFSTTGATVFGELQRSDLLPRTILFWRAMTLFLGGLGIIVLFVVLLGYGTGTKTLVRSEMTGPLKSSPTERVRHLAQIVFGIYIGLNALQTITLCSLGLTFYDSLCHSVSTIATGGFSTFNASVGHFAVSGYKYSALIEWVIVFFMFLGGTNFILIYWCLIGKPNKMFYNAEWRMYFFTVVIATAVILAVGTSEGDFDHFGTSDLPFYVAENDLQGGQLPVSETFRMTAFQVVSLMTTTGFCTDEFEKWCGLSCGILLLLMMVGACAGSTAGGMKVIRVLCVLRAVPNEIELSYRPNVVRSVTIGGEPIDRETLTRIFSYFALYGCIVIIGTLIILTCEPTATRQNAPIPGDHQLFDSANIAISCMSNVGPGLGQIGARMNFGSFTELTKLLLTGLMIVGRLEIFVILAMLQPNFWRR